MGKRILPSLPNITMLVGLIKFLPHKNTSNGLRACRLMRLQPIRAWLPALTARLTAIGLSLLLVGEAAAAIEEDAGSAKNVLPQFEVSTFPSQLFWLVFSFGILFYLMKKIFAPKIGARIAFREKIISDNVEGAEKLLTNGKKMEADLEKKLTTTREQARGEITTAAATISAKQEEALKKFQEKSDGVIEDANKMLQKIKSDIDKEKQTMVNNLSKEIVKKILS